MSNAVRFGPVLAIAAAALLAAAGPADTAAKQRIAIETRVASGAANGTFKLIPLTPGQVKAASGKLVYVVKQGATVTTLGQQVTTYTVKQTLTGTRGVIELTGVTKSTDAGGGYLAASGTWSVAGAAKGYAGMRGAGRGSGVLTPSKVFFGRYEGFVTLP